MKSRESGPSSYSYFYDAQAVLIFFHMISEPGFYQIIYNKLIGRSKDNANLGMPTMFMFASQLNAEMVYSILKGITQFSKVSFADHQFQTKVRATSVN